MGENGKPILTKIQNVMGIKNGKYCSSDVSVVSISGVEAPQNESVTYVNCPNRETVTINYGEIVMNDNIIDDCVLGGSVILNDLGGYVVNYGQTICPVIIPNVKQIQRCGSIERSISIDFGNNVVTVGNVYSLTFNGVTQPGCYTIIGDAVFSIQDTVNEIQEVPDCISCTPIPTPTPQYTQIQSCSDGSIYSVNGTFVIGNISYLTFKGGTLPSGCYTSIGSTNDSPVDSIGSKSTKYDSCIACTT